MAGPLSNDQSGIISGINVTPLVDVALVLLVIFIVTAKIVVAPAVPMDLPKTAAAEETQVVFSVVVPSAGALLVNGVPATDDESVLGRVRDAVRADTEVRAVVDADAAVPHGRVIHLLGLLRRGGISHVAFGARPAENAAQ